MKRTLMVLLTMATCGCAGSAHYDPDFATAHSITVRAFMNPPYESIEAEAKKWCYQFGRTPRLYTSWSTDKYRYTRNYLFSCV